MSFPLVGNEAVRRAVESLLKGDRFPHALIIEGESGTGKSTLARYLAAALLCEETSKPCFACKQCHLVRVGTHPDLWVVEPDKDHKNIRVDQIREMRQMAYTKPQMSRARVFLVEKADTLNESSQNALLKVLEDPPGNVYFLFMCLSAQSLLPTIRSRSICLSLTAPDAALCRKYLLQHTRGDEASATRAATLARGNIGVALSLTGRKKGEELAEAADAYVNAMQNGAVYEMIELTVKYEKDRVKMQRFFETIRLLILGLIKESYRDETRRTKLLQCGDVTERILARLDANANLGLLTARAAYAYQTIAGGTYDASCFG